MKPQLGQQLNLVNFWLFILTIFITPLLFLPLTSEYFITPKLIFLAVAILAIVLIRIVSWIFEGRILITKSPFDLALTLLVVMAFISAFFSPVRQIGFLGNLPNVDGSAISWLIYLAVYFVAVQMIKSPAQVKLTIYALLGSSFLLSLVGLLSYFGLYLPFEYAQAGNFSPTGSSFSTTSLLALVLPILLAAEIGRNGQKFLPSYVGVSLASFFSVILALIGNSASIISAGLGIVAVLIIYRRKANVWVGVIPVITFLVILLISNIALPSKLNAFHQRQISFAREIQLPFVTSWKISASTFRDSPFIGSGPSTYLFDFSLYKPAEFNSTSSWNISFDSAYNEFLQLFATLGAFGLIAFLSFSLILVSFAWQGLQNVNSNEEDFLPIGLSVTGLVIVSLFLFHVTSLVSLFCSLILLTALVAIRKPKSRRVEEIAIGLKASKLGDASLGSNEMLPMLLLVPWLVVIVLMLWKGSDLVLADYHHRQGLNVASTNGIEAYNQLVKSEQLNPNADLYRVDLAIINFNLANTIAANKGPSPSSPGGSLTDQDKQNISALINQSIAEGKTAVTLNPLSAQNWEVLGSIYRQISGVAQNAIQLSLDAYGHAIARDPLNPLLRLNVGEIYYSIKNYDLAVRFFSDSVNLKPDYANGYYNLSLALRDQGRLQDAITAAEQVAALVDPKSPDYKVAAAYLSDLKAREATASASQANTASSNQPNGPLEQTNLPKVVNLPEPSSIATPSAVGKNPEAKTPATPTPTASSTSKQSPSAAPTATP